MFAWRTLATGETESLAEAEKSLGSAAADLNQLVSITHTASKREKAQALQPVFEKYQKGLDALQRYKSFAEIVGDPAAKELQENAEFATVKRSPRCCPRLQSSTARSPTERGRGQGQRGFHVGADACARRGRSRGVARASAVVSFIAFAGRSAASPPTPARSPAATSPSSSPTRGMNEIGEMARSVDVLRAHASEKRAFSRRRRRKRGRPSRPNENVRRRKKARAAEQQTAAMLALGAGLEQLPTATSRRVSKPGSPPSSPDK